MTDPISPASPTQRVIRVFISSTFRDMQAERDELAKRIFPQLRNLCEERGVTWGEVDLRWGITEEQVSEGKVLPICLEEIHSCRPYFIGLLGERYGWVPDSIPQELIEQESWLAEHLEHSITEMEILHGVLNNPEMASHAFFYFRDPAYLENIDESARSDFLEGPIPHEVEKYGNEEATRRSQERKEKLAALKSAIVASGFPLRTRYKDPIEVGELVLKDMTNVIDWLFPKESKLGPLERETLEHEAFASKLRAEYIARETYFERLDDHALGDNLPLILLGESGSGKSSLLANWATQYRIRNPQDVLIVHFIGSTLDSADWKAMLRRIMGEIQKRFSIEVEIPEESGALRAAFSNLLHRVSAIGKLVLILDGLNQLEDRDAALDLVWLPPKIPTNVCMLLSTLPGRPLDELEKRGWPALRVETLNLSERNLLIKTFLAKYRKTLNPSRIERIANAPQSANPLYLRTLLEELRLFGIHEELDERIGSYLEATSPVTLYEKILARYEQDYERDRTGLVRDAMQMLWAARRGLSQAELRELLGSDGLPLPGAYWSPLYLAMERSLVNRVGLLGFAHDYLRQAIQKKYLPTKRELQAARLRLADYFASRDLSPRKIVELPWQLSKVGEWQRLADLLLDPPLFSAAWEENEFEVKSYWAQVETNSELHMVEAYQPFPEATAQNASYLWDLARLLHESGHPSEALGLWEELSKTYRENDDPEMLAGSLGTRAIVLRERGDLDNAMALFKESEKIFRSLNNPRKVAGSLTGQATILSDRGDLSRAMALHQECAHISMELDDSEGLVISIGSQAIILRALGKLDQAMLLFTEEERIYRELGNHDGLAISLGNQALIHHDQGNLELALDLQKKKEQICRDLGNPYSLSISLGNQGAILRELGNLDEAMALHKEKERICRELGNQHGLANSLYNQAAILHERGDLDQALAKFKEEGHIHRTSGNLEGLSISLDQQATILHSLGDLDGARKLYIEQERMCRQLGNMSALAISLDNQAVILRELGDVEGALKIGDELERITQELGNPGMLAMTLINQALMLVAAGRERKRAVQLAEEALQLAADSGLTELAQMIKSKLPLIRHNIN